MATWTSLSATTGTSGGNTVWGSWADGTTTSGSTDATWTIWAGGSATTSGSGNITHSKSHSYPAETEEQRQAREEQRQARLERERQRKEKRDVAQRKAEELLCGILDEQQLEQFKKTKWFFVVSQSGKRYRIRHGWISNIDELNRDDMVVAKYCIHPQTRAPIEDSMLIQKLMLEADESRFKEVANKTRLNTPQPFAV